jgi:hypothetical protein
MSASTSTVTEAGGAKEKAREREQAMKGMTCLRFSDVARSGFPGGAWAIAGLNGL